VKVFVAATPTSLPLLVKSPQSVYLDIVDPTTLQTPIVKTPFFSVSFISLIKSNVSPD